jgi:hypothetical protein
MSFSSSLRRCFTPFAAAIAPVALISVGFLSGCGVGTNDPGGTILPAVAGTIHGGQSPIQGATVSLFVTDATATGYGQPGILIGSDTSDSSGNFTINNPATTANCPAGQQTYITAAGGYPAGQPALTNNSALMIAATGECSTVGASTRVTINEVTSVAAAYALSGFMTTSSSGPLFKANVSAPAANNALTGTAAVAPGLSHAFLNSQNLVDYVSGNPRSVTPNISVAGTTVTGTIPTVLLNTLGDIMQSCVDGATSNSSCTSLFGFTPSISGTVPTNTLQAFINLARNPYPSAAAMNTTTGLLGLATAQSAFQPALTAAPPDWAIGIVYKGTALITPYNIALDANDTVYLGGSAAATIVGLSAYGTSTPAFTAATGTATRQIAPDSLGNIWVGNNSTLLLQYSASGGAPTTYTYAAGDIVGVAVDAASNVWVGNAVTTAGNIFELVPGSPYTVNYTATAPGGFEPVGVTIDAHQNIWTADYFTNGNLASVIPNLSAGTINAASYATSGTTATPLSATFASSAIKPLGLVIDASGNAWYGITGSNTVTTTGIEEVIPTVTSSVITSIVPQPLIANATLGAKASQLPGMDGSGSVYLPDNQGTGSLGLHVYSTTTATVLSPPSGYLGCVIATSGAGAGVTCNAGATAANAAVYNPRNVAIDSTGSVWSGITSGGLTQLIGLGAPTWPLLSVGKPGLSPGSSTVTPLP